MLLLTIHIVAIVGPDSGKHNSLPDCVVNCAPWHCPLLCPLLFLFCFLLSIISYGQSCVTGVQNFLYQDISSVIYFLCWHIFSQSFIQPRKSLMARNDVNEYHYLYVCSSRPLYGILRDNKRYAKSHYIDDLTDNLKVLVREGIKKIDFF